MNILLIALLLVQVALLVLIAWSIYKIVNVYREFRAFIQPAGEGQPSPAYQVVSASADILSRSLIAQLKGAFMGKQSGDTRGEKTVTADISEDALALANPAISAILNSFPTLKKTLRRNPALLDLALSKIGSMAGNKANGGTQVSDQAKFNL